MKQRWIAYGIPLCAALLCTAPILFRPGLPAYHHDWSLPFTTFAATSGAVGHLSTWDPAGLGHPNPFATANPVPLLLAALEVVLSPVVGGKFALLFAVALAGVGAALVARRVFNTGAWPAAAAGIAYAASPFVANEVGAGHFTLWYGYALLPWCVERAVAVARSERGAGYGLALAVALSTLAPQVFVFDLIAVAAFALTCGVRNGVRAIGIALAAGAVALAPTLWALSQARDALAIDVPSPLGSWEDAQSVKLPDAMLLVHYIEPYGQWVFGTFAWLPWITIAVAALGITVWRDRRAAAAVVLVALAGLAFETGTQGLLAGFWRYAFASLPAAAAFRELYSAGMLVAFSLACGVALATAALKRAWRFAPVAAVVAASLPMLAFGVGRAAQNVVPPATAAQTATAIAALPPGRIVPLPLLTPVIMRGVSVGGVDVLAPADERHPSMSEYLASFPVTALAAAGGPADDWWRALAAEFGATGVISRDDVRSADADRLRSHAAGLVGTSPPGVIALHGAPLVSFATNSAPQPLSYHQADALAILSSRLGSSPSGEWRRVLIMPSTAPEPTRVIAKGAALLQSSEGPLPPGLQGNAAVIAAHGQLVSDDPAKNWVDAERWRARSPAPDAAIAGGAFTETTAPFALDLAPGDSWWMLTASDEGLIVRAGGSTVEVPQSIDPTWTRLYQLFGTVQITSFGGRAIVYRAARGASEIPPGPFANASVASIVRTAPWRVNIGMAAPVHAPALLIFRERFADGWRVEGAKTMWHGMADGYANAWVIADAGDTISLTYSPQAPFEWLAAIVLLAYVACAWAAWRSGRRPEVEAVP